MIIDIQHLSEAIEVLRTESQGLAHSGDDLSFLTQALQQIGQKYNMLDSMRLRKEIAHSQTKDTHHSTKRACSYLQSFVWPNEGIDLGLEGRLDARQFAAEMSLDLLPLTGISSS